MMKPKGKSEVMIISLPQKKYKKIRFLSKNFAFQLPV